jgi:hypothetical protein
MGLDGMRIRRAGTLNVSHWTRRQLAKSGASRRQSRLLLSSVNWFHVGPGLHKGPHRHKEKRMLLLLLATSVLKAMKADGRTDGPSTDTQMMATMEWKKKRLNK